MKKADIDLIVKMLEGQLKNHKEYSLDMVNSDDEFKHGHAKGFASGYEAALVSLKNMLEVVR